MRVLWLLPRIFAGFGLVMLVVTFGLYSREQAFIKRASHAAGTVVDLQFSRGSDGGGAYYPLVAFRDVRGDSFVVRSHAGSNPPSWRRGDAVDVLYDPADPQGARIGSFFQLHLGSFISSTFALVWSLIGGIWLFVDRRGRLVAARLRQDGQRVQAKVVEIQRRTNIRVGMTHPYRIIAQGEAPAGGGVVVYRSANIWFDPTQYVGETVNVFVDRDNPKRHVVDLDFLPKLRG
jgi:hypothetical protein